MKLFTKVEIEEIPLKIQHSDRILMLGSCFADNIGQRLLTNKFHISCNPFGIIYNPVSLSKSIQRITKATLVLEEELLLCQRHYCHLDFHSQLNTLDKQTTFTGLNQAISDSHAFANGHLDWLIVSLGTSYAYQYNKTQEVVANCHKIPASEFTRRLLETKEIINALEESVTALKALNPDLKTILTVSPIRHTRDGLRQNARSKSRLIDAANTMADRNVDCYYYPAYEIMTDELRDYRWYEADLIHPNQQAINHIWEQFKTFALSDESIKMISKIEKLHRNLDHRPFHRQSEEYLQFLSATEEQMNQLKMEAPYADFSVERSQIQSLKEV